MSDQVLKPSEVLPRDYAGYVAYDTETSGLYPDDGARVSTASIAWWGEDGQVASIAFPFDQGPRDKMGARQASLFEPDQDPNLGPEEWRFMLDWLSDPRRLLVMHNAKFDILITKAGVRPGIWGGGGLEGGIDLLDGLVWDTQIANKEIWPIEATGLKPTAVRLWGEGEDSEQAAVKAWLKKNRLTMGDADKVPWEIVGPYAAKDTNQTLRLQRAQEALVNEGAVQWATLARKFQVTRTLTRIEMRGLGFDAAGCLDAALKLEQMQAEIGQRLPFQPGPTEAKEYFFGNKPGSLGLSPLKATPAGAASLDNEVTWRLAAKGVAGAQDWADYSRYGRALSMWYRGYPALVGDDGRLRTCFRQTAVKSGRMSVERVNLQAIPKDDKGVAGVPTIRSFVRAKDGHDLWNLDLSQAELRVSAKYAGCNRMLEMLLGGADLHTITTKDVLGVDETDPNFKYHRGIGKRLTFGSIFQIGGKSFKDQLAEKAHIDLSLKECNKIVYGWRRLYPEFGQAYEGYQQIAQRKGYITLLPGTDWQTRSYFGPRDWPNTAWSRLVQGSLAEFVQNWIWHTDRICAEMGYPDALVLTVHDSVVLELPKGEGLEVVQAVKAWAERVATALFGIDMIVDYGLWHKD